MNTPPNVSTPNDKGVTSNKRISSISPAITAPCIAAPIATHSIGSTECSGSFPKNFLNLCWTAGILVGPPTNITLSTSATEILASDIALCIIGSNRFNTGSINCSSLALVSSISK